MRGKTEGQGEKDTNRRGEREKRERNEVTGSLCVRACVCVCGEREREREKSGETEGCECGEEQ